mmetsp:Transcript_21704/g.38342  ORF Transcript_21704/g.38342 Transcript_21704/m.38342 type:complete len:480 (-) Transcript_21704:32-1471(-)
MSLEIGIDLEGVGSDVLVVFVLLLVSLVTTVVSCYAFLSLGCHCMSFVCGRKEKNPPVATEVVELSEAEENLPQGAVVATAGSSESTAKTSTKVEDPVPRFDVNSKTRSSDQKTIKVDDSKTRGSDQKTTKVDEVPQESFARVAKPRRNICARCFQCTKTCSGYWMLLWCLTGIGLSVYFAIDFYNLFASELEDQDVADEYVAEMFENIVEQLSSFGTSNTFPVYSTVFTVSPEEREQLLDNNRLQVIEDPSSDSTVFGKDWYISRCVPRCSSREEFISGNSTDKLALHLITSLGSIDPLAIFSLVASFLAGALTFALFGLSQYRYRRRSGPSKGRCKAFMADCFMFLVGIGLLVLVGMTYSTLSFKINHVAFLTPVNRTSSLAIETEPPLPVLLEDIQGNIDWIFVPPLIGADGRDASGAAYLDYLDPQYAEFRADRGIESSFPKFLNENYLPAIVGDCLLLYMDIQMIFLTYCIGAG